MRVELRTPHREQQRFIDSVVKRIVCRAGRRGGKTTGVAQRSGKKFMAGRRVLYAVPTDDQKQKFWFEIKRMFQHGIESGALYKNETSCILEIPGTETRIRAKTAYDPDTMRGDYADDLILDEFQLMKETAWTEVGAPMLLDNDGDAMFIYTPPSIRSSYRSRARDPRHASKMFKRAENDKSGRWATFHFSSHDNPFISRAALAEIAGDMTPLAYRQEILAEDIDDNPSAMWRREYIDHDVLKAPDLARVVVGVDPSGSKSGDAVGIITAGMAIHDGEKHLYTLADDTLQGTPDEWGRAVVTAYHRHKAGLIVAERNFGGDMVEHTIHTIDPNVPVKLVHASRGKAVRAEPVSVVYAKGRGHHVGGFMALEDELCQWEPGTGKSPNRLDALVWCATELVIGKQPSKPAGSQTRGIQLHRRGGRDKRRGRR